MTTSHHDAGEPSAPQPPAGAPGAPISAPAASAAPHASQSPPPGAGSTAAPAGHHGSPAGTGTDPLDRFFAWLRGLGLTRRTDDKWAGGVASGIADRLRVDPVLVRAGFVLLALFIGFGITLYLLAWTFLPDRRGRIAAEDGVRHGDGGGIVLLILAGLALFSGFPWWVGPDSFGLSFPWALLVIGALTWWVVTKRNRQTPQERAEWDRRAAQWGEDVGTKVGEWGDQVGARASQIGRPATSAPAPTDPMGRSAEQYGQTTQTSGAAAPGMLSAAAVHPAAADVVRPAEPAVPRRRSGGFLLTLVALGLALLVGGTTVWLGDTFGWQGDHVTTGLYAALVALGALVVVVGLMGWRSGFVGFMAGVVAVLAALSLAFPDGRRFGGEVGDMVWKPSELGSGQEYRISAGDAVLDLGDLPAEGLSDELVRVSVGAGELVVRVPEDLTVRVDGHVGMGNLDIPIDDNNDGSGVGLDRSVTLGEGPVEVVVTADVGLGQLTVTQTKE